MRGVRRNVPSGGGRGGSGGLASQGHRNRARGGASESYILDRLLLPRLKQYSYNNQVSNIDSTVDYLRTNYREYRRKQQGPFRKLVIKAVNALRKQVNDQGGDAVEEQEARVARSRRDEEENLRVREEGYMMRYRANNNGQQNGELEAESLDNSSENSDGVESEGMSDGVDGEEEDGRNNVGNGNSRESNGKTTILPRRNLKAADRSVGRREGKEKETSDSEEELAFDGMDEEEPALNLLNSSLRATYNGRPALVRESSSGMDKTGFAGSSSLFKFPSAQGGLHANGVQGESSSRAGLGSSSVMDSDSRPAFAEPSVVAEAARAALSGKRSRKGPVIDQETREAFGRGFSNLVTAERDLHRGSPPAQSSGRPPQANSMTREIHSSSRSTSAPVLRLRIEQKVSEEHPCLERMESGVGTHEGPEQLLGKYRERENGKSRSSKRRKSKDGKQNGMSEIAQQEKSWSSPNANPRDVSFKDLGGIESTLDIIRETIEYPLVHPELYEHLGVPPPRGVLLHGPPGCGKTMLANAIAVETGVPFLKVSAPEVVSGMSGESEAKVRALFTEAVRVAPSIVFIDEIDAITPKRETAQREMERRIVAQLLTCMDDLSLPLSEKDGAPIGVTKKHPRHVIVIGATNRPDALDPALRRAGRFDREIALGIPDEQARAKILATLAQKLRLEGSFDFKQIAKRTPGFVGADLAALTKEAAAVAVKRIFIGRDPRLAASPSSDAKSMSNVAGESKMPLTPYKGPLDGSRAFEAAHSRLEDRSTQGLLKGTRSSSPESASVCKDPNSLEGDQEHWRRPWTRDEMESLSITMQDFEAAVAKVQPSAKREGFATIPDVTWDDVGSLGAVREELEFSISRPIKHPEEYQALGIDMAMGVLLYGPPGCGKTLVAKAIANDAGANFISVKGPELLNKYVGESERAVRQLFTRARASAPCVLFFDEMDAMAPKRGSDGNGAAERVVNQLLTEMDGLESRRSIYIIAATNRPDMIDPALLRPGRLDKLLYVPLPDQQGRASILRALVRTVPLAPDIDVSSIGESSRCDGFSGADLASLIREACIASLREKLAKSSGPSSGLPLLTVSSSSAPMVSRKHFDAAFTKVYPSVSTKDRSRYELQCKTLRCARGNIKDTDQESNGRPSLYPVEP